MTADYPTDTAAATPEYAFDLFRQSIALRSPWPASAPAVAFEDVADEPAARHWLWLSDLDWILSDLFGLDIPFDELDSYHGRTVRELCAFVASRITRPVIRPWKHVAGDCLPAGAFLTVRSMLAARGADPAAITPSTPLAPFVYRYRDSLVPGLARLAPGRVPPVTERFPLAGFLCVMLAPVPMLLVFLLEKWGIKAPVETLLTTVFGGFVISMTGLGLMMREQRRPRFGELQTFRDLAHCLAGQQPRRPIQPTA